MKKSIARMGLAAIAGFVAIVSPALAADTWSSGGIDMQVKLKEEGRNARFFPADHSHASSGSSFYAFRHVEGVLGGDYDIVLGETNGQRVKLCVAVDGRSVMDGRKITAPENSADWGSCYVANPFQRFSISGWRESRDAVRQFYFTSDQNALAAWRWGDYGALGTIVVAIFREQQVRPQLGMPRRGSGERSLGTGAGERVESHVDTVSFRSQPYATDVAVMHYDTLQGLRRIGVNVDNKGEGFGRYGDAQEKYIDFDHKRR